MPIMKCKAEMHISDDEGDQHATMTCGLEVDHLGPHEERWNYKGRTALCLWEGDGRKQS